MYIYYVYIIIIHTYYILLSHMLLLLVIGHFNIIRRIYCLVHIGHCHWLFINIVLILSAVHAIFDIYLSIIITEYRYYHYHYYAIISLFIFSLPFSLLFYYYCLSSSFVYFIIMYVPYHYFSIIALCCHAYMPSHFLLLHCWHWYYSHFSLSRLSPLRLLLIHGRMSMYVQLECVGTDQGHLVWIIDTTVGTQVFHWH